MQSMNTTIAPNTLENTLNESSSATLLPQGTWFYRQDEREVEQLTQQELSALVRLGYVRKGAVVGNGDGVEQFLSQRSELLELISDPFETLTYVVTSNEPVGTWFYRQEGQTVGGLTEAGLAALVRLGYVRKGAVVGADDVDEQFLSHSPNFNKLMFNPFVSFPRLEKNSVDVTLSDEVLPMQEPPSLISRFASLMIDSALIGAISTAISLVATPLTLALGAWWLSLLVIWFASATMYFGLSEHSHRNSTLGQRLLGLKVSSVTSKPVGMLRSIFRGALKTVSILVLPIAAIVAASSKDKRALHDKLTQTKVVRV